MKFMELSKTMTCVKIYTLVIYFITYFIHTGTSRIKLGKFTVKKNFRVLTSLNADEILIKKNIKECTMLFNLKPDHCIAEYNNVTKECKLFPPNTGCCLSNTQPRKGYFIVRRHMSSVVKTNEDCGFHQRSSGISGVYTIYPEGYPSGISVYCDLDTDNGGWIVIQKRFDGSFDFYRTWIDYRDGFGTLTGEFWIGNEKLHHLTKTDKYMLRVELEDTSGIHRYAEYYTFIVSDESNKYNLTIGEYCGDAGDAMFYNDNNIFHTKDQDSTVGYNGNVCSVDRHAGFWFNECTWANLNGRWSPGDLSWDSVFWYQWKVEEGMASVSMKIRRKS